MVGIWGGFCFAVLDSITVFERISLPVSCSQCNIWQRPGPSVKKSRKYIKSIFKYYTSFHIHYEIPANSEFWASLWKTRRSHVSACLLREIRAAESPWCWLGDLTQKHTVCALMPVTNLIRRALTSPWKYKSTLGTSAIGKWRRHVLRESIWIVVASVSLLQASHRELGSLSHSVSSKIPCSRHFQILTWAMRKSQLRRAV